MAAFGSKGDGDTGQRQTKSASGSMRFWYGVTFGVGVYVGISYVAKWLDVSLILWGPIGLCLTIAGFEISVVSLEVIRVALDLYAVFVMGFGIGYAIADALSLAPAK